MSGIVGLSNKEIKALAQAAATLEDLAAVTRVESYSETAKTLGGILKRVSIRHGTSAEMHNSLALMNLLEEMLPPEDEET